MRLVFILTILISHTTIFAQVDNCKNGIDSAIRNIKLGNLIYYEFGFPGNSRTFENLLRKKIGIKLESGGCLMPEDKICYNQLMEDTISTRFGFGILDSLRREAQFLDSIGQGTRMAYYKDMYNEEMHNIVYCKVNEQLLSEKPIRYAPRVIVRIIINEQGLPMEYKYILKHDSSRDLETLKIAKTFSKFNYATKDGIPIEDYIDISICFSKEIKQNIHCH